MAYYPSGPVFPTTLSILTPISRKVDHMNITIYQFLSYLSHFLGKDLPGQLHMSEPKWDLRCGGHNFEHTQTHTHKEREREREETSRKKPQGTGGNGKESLWYSKF